MALLTGGVSDIIFSRTSDRVLGMFRKHSRKKVLEGQSQLVLRHTCSSDEAH